MRRFRCLNRSCQRRTFAERLPEVVAFAARRTVRLTALLQIFAIQCAGEPGSRVLSSIGMQVSPDTLLRLAKAAPTLSSRVPTVLGVDDFALGAPEAQQATRRWHLQKNWREALERVLNRVRARSLQAPSTQRNFCGWARDQSKKLH